MVHIPWRQANDRAGPIPWHAAVAFAVIAIGAVVVLATDGDTRAIAASVAVFTGTTTAGVLFVQRSKILAPRERRAWTFVGRGLLIGAAGIIAVAAWGAIVGETPTFGVTDVFFVVGYVVVIVGIAMLPHTAGTGWQRIRIGLDATIGAISVGALAWVFVIDPIVIGLEGAPIAARVFGVLYPLVDVGALIAIVIVTIRRSSLQFDFRMLLLGGALVFQTIGDVSLLVSGNRTSLEEAEPIFVAYLAASAFFLLTAMNADRMPAPRAHADRVAPAWAMVVPYAAATIMVVGLMHRLWDGSVDTDDRILLVSTVLVVVLVVSRQALSIRENRALVEQQRSDLVSSISHELRTPLTSMVGFVSVLKDGQDLTRSERSEMMGVVADQAEYLARIVEDLLTFTQGGTDAVDLDVTEQRIQPLIENAILATSIDRNRVEVEVNPTLTALVDGSRIQQILVNLLSNADRYGGDQCLVVASAVGSGLTIEVHDSGPGVPKKHEVVIWERFERGANRYNAGTPGSGIGLAMVKSLAEAHGGRASYRRSNRLGGACFVVDLPGRVGKQQPIVVVPSSTRAIG